MSYLLSIRMPVKLLKELKKTAIVLDVPYQTLIKKLLELGLEKSSSSAAFCNTNFKIK